MAKDYGLAFRRIFRLMKKKNSRKTAEDEFKKQVLDNVNFQNHIKEVAFKMDIPEDIVLRVVSHYFRFIILKILNLPKNRVKVLIYGFFYLEMINPLYNEYSMYSIKYIRKNFNQFFYVLRNKINQNGKR